MSSEVVAPPLNWDQLDIERKLGLPGSKYTNTSKPLTMVLGLFMAAVFYGVTSLFDHTHFGQMFLDRGYIPYVIVLFFCWCLATLFVKWRKLALQRKALEYAILPESVDFVLSPLTAKDVMNRIYMLADKPDKFLLFNRTQRALSSLRNIGRVSDIDDILRSQADNDEGFIDATYSSMRGLIWAIPVLGFIGTVLGLSDAIGGFGQVLAASADMAQIRDALLGVTGGLSVAFETTLIGLVSAVILQLLVSSIKQKEDLFLDACKEYCHKNIVTKLRTLQVSDENQVEGAP